MDGHIVSILDVESDAPFRVMVMSFGGSLLPKRIENGNGTLERRGGGGGS